MEISNGSYNDTTDPPHYTTTYYDTDEKILHRASRVFYGLLIIIGTPTNLWFLTALATSQHIRTRLCNQMMCIILAIFLFECAVVMPFYFRMLFGESLYSGWHCSMATAFAVLDFTSDWLIECALLVWITLYVVTLIGMDFYKRFSPLQQKTGRCILLFGPVVLCSILGPSIYAYHSHQEYGFHPLDCLSFVEGNAEFYDKAIVLIPFFAKVVLIPVILFLHRRVAKLRRNSALPEDSIRQQVVDTPTAYVTACAVGLAATSMMVVDYHFRSNYDSLATKAIFWYPANYILPRTRCVLVSLCFLILPDIRYRVKTWRPWRRTSVSELDTAVRYQRHGDEITDIGQL